MTIYYNGIYYSYYYGVQLYKYAIIPTAMLLLMLVLYHYRTILQLVPQLFFSHYYKQAHTIGKATQAQLLSLIHI